MPLDSSRSESDRLQKKQKRVIYSNYLAAKTRYDSGTPGDPVLIIAGTGSSLESSALENIIIGELSLTPEEKAAIIANNQTIFYGSILFVPNSYLQSDLQTNFSMGTSDFTIECWAKTNQAITGGWTNLVTVSSSGSNDIRIAAGGDFFAPNSGKIGFIVPNADNTDVTRYRVNNTMAVGVWYHFALVRSSGSIKLYINGTSQSFTNDGNGTSFPNGATATFNHTGPCRIYVNTSLFNESQFSGLISNIRLVKGLAVYTTNFSVPVRPLSTIADTKILLNTGSSSTYLVDSSSYNNVVSATGGLAYSSSNPFA